MNEVLRHEKKFLITLSQMYEHFHRLNKIMKQDEHNFGEGYLIRSLYFDTLGDRDFTEKKDGVELRRKLRLRSYGPDYSFGVLEMKQKEGQLQKKRSLKLSREDAIRLADRDYEVLLKYDTPFAGECFSILNMYGYVPKVIVEYQRKAFVAKENKIRITFDHHITGTQNCRNFFDTALLQNPILDPYLVVLEVKYNGFLLSYIKDMLKEVDRSETSVSKYCLSRSGLY